MIEQQGRIERLEDTRAVVRIGPVTGCSACDAGRGCGAGIFARLLRRKSTSVVLNNSIGAVPGQAVTVGIPESVFLRLLLRFYLLPVCMGLAGAAFGHYLAGRISAEPALTDGISLVAAVLFTGLALWTGRNRQLALASQSGLRLQQILQTTEDNEVYTCLRNS